PSASASTCRIAVTTSRRSQRRCTAMQQHPVAEWGAIHGRFQPFHLGHFSYMLQAADKAEVVVIGITNPFVLGRPVVEPTDVLRHLPSNNPFTYFERAEIITSAILYHDPSMLSRVRIVP